ncbi:MAG TPA: carboxypeptidase-like regulatory domain-containing protein [Polyangiaceae bacterium]|nr:carboxypeptidase-like regulatory domain-containing protein [Polyangiaceae bacterium]
MPGSYEVRVYCEGAIPREDRLHIVPGAVSRRWDLEPGLVLGGNTRRANGQPLAGATISAEMLSEGNALLARRPPTCRTDDDGNFRCAGFTPGAYRCSVSGRGLIASQQVTLSANGPEPLLRFVAAPMGTLRARFIGADARTVGLQLVARHEQSQRLSRGEPIEDAVIFEDIPLGRYALSATLDFDEPDASAAIDSDAQVVDIAIPAPSTEHVISGRIVDGEGGPINGAWVRAQSMAQLWGVPTDAIRASLSDGDGRFVLEGLTRGSYAIAVTSAAGDATQQNVASDTLDLRIELSLPPTMDGQASSSAGRQPN